jgi:hypothetical protein
MLTNYTSAGDVTVTWKVRTDGISLGRCTFIIDVSGLFTRSAKASILILILPCIESQTWPISYVKRPSASS